MTAHALLQVAQWTFLVYFIALSLTYIGLNIISMRVIGRTGSDVSAALPPTFTGLQPPISLIVPAYNEEATICATVWSLLQLEYSSFEIVVVNDGSRDGTLEVLRREFDLRPFPEATRVSIRSRAVRGIWRSARFHDLRVIDKENGGKADALNAGINSAHCPLVCVVDADSVLQRDSLARAVRPFLEDPTTIASGGTIRIANGCRVSEGFLEAIGMPRSWLARIQVVEYFRAFLFGRMGWSPLNAMLVISGAFGVFRRQAVIEAGGYRTDTVGEDMELVVRLHRLHRAARKPYRIVFVPDPICWTEAPESLRVLRAQRTRWQRGLLESLAANRTLLFSRTGGTAGWIAFPVALLFEALGPIVEVIGLAIMTVAWLGGGLGGTAFVAFLAAAFGVGLLLSASALLLEELSFHAYERPAHLAILVAAMLLENLGYRQLTAWWRLTALLQWVSRRPGSWGRMERSAAWHAPRGPASASPAPTGIPVAAVVAAPVAPAPAPAAGARDGLLDEPWLRAALAAAVLGILLAGARAGPERFGRRFGLGEWPLTQEEARALVERAEALSRTGRDAEAYPLARRLHDEFPASPVHVRRLAALEGRLGRPAAEAALWERFVTLSPTPLDAFPALPDAYRRAGDLAAAQAAAERGVALDPTNPDLHLGLARILEARREFARARDVYRAASATAPRYADLVTGWARAELFLGDARRAQELAIQVVAARPQDPDALLVLGMARRSRGDLRGAREALQAGRALRPGDPDFLAALAAVAEGEGRPDEAGALYDAYLRRVPGDAEVAARRARLGAGAPRDGAADPRAAPEVSP